MVSRKQPVNRAQLTRAGLAEAVYRHGGLSKSEAGDAVASVLDILKSGLQSGRKIKITNFGVFEIKSRRGRIGVDPVSGERIMIPARRRLSFRPSEKLQSLVQGEPTPSAPRSLILLDETKKTDS